MSKLTSCNKCGASKLVLANCNQRIGSNTVDVTVLCERCGRIHRSETTERIDIVRTWFTEN